MGYITCHHRKSWPTIPTVVCEKCERMGKCADYQNYVHPSLFPNLCGLNGLDTGKKKSRRKKIKPEDAGYNGPEQLTFDL